MRIIHFLFLLIITGSFLFGQPNCEAYKYYGDTLKYEACKKAEERNGHYQFSMEYQAALDASLEIDPTFDFAYRAKSVAYLKSGDFLTWKFLIDKAVELNPIEHIGYRGWCRYQFFRDYEGAILDIEKLDSLTDFDIGESANGDYHLHVARALCYKAIKKEEKALEIMETQLFNKDHFVGIYDYLHLGVLYFEKGDFEKAMRAFEVQEKENSLAENQYYMARTFKALGNESRYLGSLMKSKELYEGERRLSDTYTHPYDKIYLEDILSELKIAERK